MTGMTDSHNILKLNGEYNMYTAAQMSIIDYITTGINKACLEGDNYVRVHVASITKEDARVVVEYFQNRGMTIEYLQVLSGTAFWLSWEVCL